MSLLPSSLGDASRGATPSVMSSSAPLPAPSAFTLGRKVLRKPSKKFFLSLGGLEGTSSLSTDPCFLIGIYVGIRDPVEDEGGAGGGGGGLELVHTTDELLATEDVGPLTPLLLLTLGLKGISIVLAFFLVTGAR